MQENLPIDPFRRVTAVWDWLPVFRVVAECEHLPTAAKRLGLTASAVSRTIRVLEEQLNREVFDRVGRSLKLNADGHALLSGVRDAMRRMDEALLDVSAERFHGPLKLSAPAHLAVRWLLPVLQGVVEDHPDLRPDILFVPPTMVAAALREGRIDLALSTELVPHEEVRTVPIGKEAHGVFCGRGHPLWGRTEVQIDEVVRHPFCGPPPDPGGMVRDGWPVELPRTVSVHFGQMAVGVGACEAGNLLAVLPALWADRSPGTLWRVPIDVIPDKQVFAVLRPRLFQAGPADLVLARLCELKT